MASRRPPYIPPKYLTSGSFLTAEHLTSAYEEFLNSLRYASTAPELVFERLVGSLRDPLDAALQNYAEQTRRKTLEGRKPRSVATAIEGSQEHDEVEVEEDGAEGEKMNRFTRVKDKMVDDGREISSSSRRNSCVNPIAENHRGEIKSTDSRRMKGSLDAGGPRLIYRFVPHSIPFLAQLSSPPDIPLTLTTISTSGSIQWKSLEITKESIATPAFESPDIQLQIGINWLLVHAEDTDLQFGKIDSASVSHIGDRFTKEIAITFPRPYTAIPVVVVWLFNLPEASGTSAPSHSKFISMRTFITDITRTGFRLHFQDRCDNGNPITFTWVACSENRPNFHKGTFSTTDIRPADKQPQAFNGGYTKFDSAFTSPPRVMIGFESLDLRYQVAAEIDTYVGNVTETGMSWHINATGGDLYSANISYLAFS